MKIAIVGMAFRFPGDLATEDAFWRALKDGRDMVGHIGEDRWATDVYTHPKRNEPGRSITFSAGVLSRLDEFDAAFFGISPREAARLDPQQRLLLEMAWEAMENGGQLPARLAGSDCAVYVGISGLDYGMRALDDLSVVDAYSMTGNTLSIAANRLSYVFDLRGPSMAVDTACSSSLVALHQACRGLRDGESSMALVGGVNLLLHPYPFVGFTKASMLAAGGRCRTFDAAGDGYVRAEGGAILLLKPLEQAEADGDPIQAVILASGSNSDGGRKSGITIPSADGQADLLRQVLKQAGLSPADLDYMEAHGTGTAVGDPIETAAIGGVIGRHRPADKPLHVGSVKSNLGHLEPASGMAGLIKTVLALKHRGLPPSLHLTTPNPHIDFAGLNLKVVTEYLPLPKSDRPLRMGVNSFGFGGANAHVMLEEYRGVARRKRGRKKDAPVPPLFLSARAPQALRELAGRHAELLRQASAPDYHDLAHSAAYRRQRLEKRLAVFGADRVRIADRLAAYAQGENVEGVVEEDVLSEPARLALVYSGNGSQWLGMGRRLLEESVLFARTMAEVDELIRRRAGFSPIEELRATPERSRMEYTEVAQPALFAMQVAITRVLRAQGLDADAATGHSVGEVAAAWAVGALSLEQAVDVICARSAAQGATKGMGRMAAAALSEENAREAIRLAGLEDTVEVAALNSPGSVTLSGSFAGLDALRSAMETRGVFFRLLDLDYAFHSQYMDSIRTRLLRDLAGLAPSAGGGRFISTVTGAELSGERLDAGYWWDNVRQPVRFEQAIGSLAQAGYRVYLEIGPHAILQRYIGECLSAAGVAGRALPTLRRDDDGAARLTEAALRAHLLGCPLNLDVHFPHAGRFTPLPAYPWQRERHWYAPTSEAYDLINRRRVHPLLGYRLKDGEALWENTLDSQVLPYLADHQVAGAVVLPGAAYVEMALAASVDWFGHGRHELEELDILAPVVFDGEHARVLRFELSLADGSFRIRSRQRLSGDDWTLNAVGRLLGEPLLARPPAQELEPPPDAVAVDGGTHYRMARSLGLEYGPAFQSLDRAWVRDHELLARLAVPETVQAGARDYVLHPAVLDVCFQSLLDLFQDDIAAGGGATLLPVKVGRLRHFGGNEGIAWFRTRLVRQSPRSVLAEFQLFDAEGRTVALLEGCRFRGAALRQQGLTPPALWKDSLRLQPHPAEQTIAPIAPSRDLARQSIELLAELEPSLHREDHFLSAGPLLDALVISYAHETFQRLSQDHGEWLAAALSDPGVLDEGRRPLFNWIIALLKEEGLLLHQAGAWTLLTDDAPPPAEGIWRAILGDSPDYLPDLVFVGRVGRHLPELLAGGMEIEPFVASLRGSHLLEQLYDASPTYLGMNLAVREIIRLLAACWPDNRRLRILEISGGSEALPRQLLIDLPEGRCEYVIAESDSELLARLEAEYAGHPCVTVATLESEGISLKADAPLPAQFDVILAHHWLHRVGDMRLALGGIKRKLAQGGLLLLVERHPDRAADLQFGLDPRWWHDAGEAGEAGQVSSLLAPGAWSNLLADQGYVDMELLREPASNNMAAGAYALLAKNPDALEELVEPGPATWLLLCDGAGASRKLAELLVVRLRAQGQRVALATPDETPAADERVWAFDPDSQASCRDLLERAVQELGGCDNLVHLLGLADGLETADLDVMAVQERRCVSTLHLVHAIASTDWAGAPPRLWLATAGGSCKAGREGGLHRPSQAPLWGFGRVIMNEHPDLRCTLIDLQMDSGGAAAADGLRRELLSPDGEDEVVLNESGRYVPRMQRGALAEPDAESMEDSGFRLDFMVPGQLRNLHWRPWPTRSLADDEIEIRPAAVGLNFRDVMYAMGLLSDEAVENGFSGATLGLELAGSVTRVGTRVTEFRVGDDVVAFAPACFSSQVITKAGSAAPKPATWSFEEAATVPTVFFTVYYALKHLADVQPGERVLIHGAAGGVGIAAIQVARYLGAEIFATAGSDEKRDFVHMLGADHVMSSRNLAFADEVLAITGGRGVDVVLNSLAGEAINRNLRVLRPFGRFLELGKRDFYENTHIGLRPFKDNISYFGIDADQLMVERPALATRLFREVMELFERGVLRPLPYRTFPATRVVDAFRYMQQARQIGKIVVTMNEAGVQVSQPPRAIAKPQLSRDASYLVTGGLGGFGLKSARWLAQSGAGHLVLLGRRGLETPGVQEAVAEIEALGASVHIRACDVTDRDSLAGIIAEIRRDLPPLRGVLHAAMVLDDGLIRNLDGERFRAALAPKILGAWNLHLLTLELPLDFFILYSSATTFIGNPGQANYVAANLYLESLAAMRRARGLPATSVCWGAIGDVGYLSRHEAVKDGLQARLGGAALSSDQALDMLGAMLTGDQSGLAVLDFDWHSVQRLLPATRGPRFDLLRRGAGKGNAALDSAEDIHSLIAGQPPEEVKRIVRELLTGEVAQILQIPPERIDASRSLYDLGMDSLMGVELVLGIEKRFGVNLPVMALNEGPSIERIAERLAAHFNGDAAAAEEPDHLKDMVSSMAAQHAESVSDEEVAQAVEEVRTQAQQGARLIS
jgi:acyl transferase domain-containing protein/NADPH:quinone reductase-like Zn-dependent oxidoreductase/acyl carrier protein